MNDLDNAIVAEEETPALRLRLAEAERLLREWSESCFSYAEVWLAPLVKGTEAFLAGATPAPAGDALAEACSNLIDGCNENHDGHDDSICRVCTLTVLAERALAAYRAGASS